MSLEDGSEWAPQRAIRERVTAALTAYTRNWHVVRAWIQAEGIHPEVEQTRSRIRESITGTLAELLASDQRKGLIEPDVDTLFASRALVRDGRGVRDPHSRRRPQAEQAGCRQADQALGARSL